MSLNIDRALYDTESVLEFVLVSLCKSLKIKPKQAAGLLTNNNQYLVHACVKGLKGNFEPVIAWYKLILQDSRHLVELGIAT